MTPGQFREWAAYRALKEQEQQTRQQRDLAALLASIHNAACLIVSPWTEGRPVFKNADDFLEGGSSEGSQYLTAEESEARAWARYSRK